MWKQGISVIVVFTTLLLILSCSETENPTNSSTDLSSLSGTWVGTVTIEKVGNCTVGGGDSILTGNAVMEWTVDDNGSTTITEYTFDSEWHGTINNNLGITVQKTVRFVKGQTMADGICAVDTVIDTCSYISWIISDSSGYHITMSATENWCPDNNCQYKVSYSVHQGI